MKKITYIVLGVFLIASLAVLGGCGEADQDRIVLGHAPYDYEVPAIEITKIIAEELGYEVEVLEGDIGFMFLSLTQGDIDLWPTGIWLPSIHSSYHEQYGDQYELGSAVFESAPLGWAVPQYVDIDSVEDIKGNEELFDNRIYALEPGTGMTLTTEEMIEAYELDLEVMHGSMAAMMSEVDYAFSQEEPIMFLAWRPHTMMRNYDIKILDEDRGFWEYDDAFIGIALGFQDKSPELYNFAKNFQMSIEETEAFLVGYQEEGRDVEELAAEWIEANREDIDRWLEG